MGKRNDTLIDADGQPPKPTDIEGRPAVGKFKGDDPMLAALIKHHPERDPARIKLLEDVDDNDSDSDRTPPADR